jgi:hypothetical protein
VWCCSRDLWQPTVEHAWTMVSKSNNTGCWPMILESSHVTREAPRQPPMHPERLRALLETKAFTSPKADRPLVAGLYEETVRRPTPLRTPEAATHSLAALQRPTRSPPSFSHCLGRASLRDGHEPCEAASHIPWPREPPRTSHDHAPYAHRRPSSARASSGRCARCSVRPKSSRLASAAGATLMSLR